MANTTFYERGNAYHDSSGNPAIIKNGNELTFTEHFNAGGGGGTPYTPPAYSTEEVNTGRKWIDGKDIYEKVIDYTGALSNTAVTIASNVDYVSQITNALCIAENVSEGFSPIVIWLEGNNLMGRSVANYSSQLLHIVIEYTKPTTRKSKKKG